MEKKINFYISDDILAWMDEKVAIAKVETKSRLTYSEIIRDVLQTEMSRDKGRENKTQTTYKIKGITKSVSLLKIHMKNFEQQLVKKYGLVEKKEKKNEL